MSHRNAEFDFANDATFQKRLAIAMDRAAVAIMTEATDPAHGLRSQKRWALANAVVQSPAAYVGRFAEAVVAYAGSAIGAAVDFAYDGHVPADGNNPTAPETAAISTAANNGVSDAQIDAAVAAVWNALADSVPTD